MVRRITVINVPEGVPKVLSRLLTINLRNIERGLKQGPFSQRVKERGGAGRRCTMVGM